MKTPPFCAPDKRCRLPGREAEDEAGIGLKDQFLHEIGGHRQEDEEREIARFAF